MSLYNNSVVSIWHYQVLSVNEAGGLQSIANHIDSDWACRMTAQGRIIFIGSDEYISHIMFLIYYGKIKKLWINKIT